MLMLEFSFLQKTPKTFAPQLTYIHRTAKINNITKYALLSNITTKTISSATQSSKETFDKINTSNESDIKTNPSKIKRPRGRPPKISLQTNKNLLDKFFDFETYLQYASHKSLKTNSGIFLGNLYELQVKHYLEKTFKIQNILHQGGSNDKGIDINAIWNPTKIFDENEFQDLKSSNKMKTKFEIVNSKKIKPIIQRSNKTLKLFVQCKCFNTSKVDPKLIREIKGSCQEYFKKHGNSAVFMLASTNGFTKVGKEDFDKAPLPLIYMKFSKPKLIDSNFPYNINSWEMGELIGMYLNPLAIALFKGLNWIEFTKNLS
jgi:hypothetical protein